MWAWTGVWDTWVMMPAMAIVNELNSEQRTGGGGGNALDKS